MTVRWLWLFDESLLHDELAWQRRAAFAEARTFARGAVTSAKPAAKKRGIARQTPRVSLSIRRTALARRPLGRRELRHLTDWNDGEPGTELNFKFYRQATNKIVGLSDSVAAFLASFFVRP